MKPTLALSSSFFHGANDISSWFLISVSKNFFSGTKRARVKSIFHWYGVFLWLDLIYQRVSTPNAPPSFGVSINGNGTIFVDLQLLAAKCIRLICVRVGICSSSAMISGGAPILRLSSMHHSVFLKDGELININRYGLTHFETPFGLIVCLEYEGRIHNIGPLHLWAKRNGKNNLAGP